MKSSMTHATYRAYLLAAAAAGAMLAGTGAAHAQATPPAEEAAQAASANDALDDAGPSDGEIVVTARRQAESLQDVPVNVTAYNSEGISKLGIKNLNDLMLTTPGFSYGTTGQRNGNRVTMRGLGISTTGSSKTSFFLDGVYIAGDFSGLSLAGLERIEVLKGPQSAVFGRTTFAGAINYVTREPTNELSGGASFDYASFGEVRADGYVSFPIIDDKLHGLITTSLYDFAAPEAWRDVSDSSRHGSQSSRGVMGKLTFTPSDAITLRTLVSYNHNDDGPASALFINPAARNGSFTKINPITNLPTGVIARYPTGDVPTFAPTPGTYNFFQDYLNNVGDRVTQWRTYAQLEWEILDGHVLTITGAQNDQENTGESNGFLRGRPPAGFVTNAYSFSHIADDSVEVRFASPQDQWFRYAGGVYYLDIEQRNRPGTSYLVSPTVAGDQVQVGANGINQNTNKSVFGALYIDPIEKLTISLEGRYQSERIKRTGFNAGTITLAAFRAGTLSPLTPILAPDGSEFSGKFTAFLPRINAQYHFNDDVNIYATFSKGNNPGGFNTSQFALADQLIIEEENLFNYEIGAKARLFDGLSIDIAAYQMDWKDQQTTGTFFSPTNIAYGIVENRGASKIKGVDVDINWRTPLDGLSIRAAGAYNDGKYDNYCSTNLAALLYTLPATATPAQRIQFACVPVDGNQLESVSKWQVSLSGDYVFPITDEWEGFVRSDYQYMSRQWDSEFNFAKGDRTDVVNARVGLQNETFTLEAYVKNLTKEDSPTRLTRASDPFAGPNNQTNQTIAFTPRLPRQFGVRAAVRF